MKKINTAQAAQSTKAMNTVIEIAPNTKVDPLELSVPSQLGVRLEVNNSSMPFIIRHIR